MINLGVTGRFVDELGVGIAGVRVVVLDKDGLFGDPALGSADTSATGDFTVSYPPGAYGLGAPPAQGSLGRAGGNARSSS